MENVIRNLISDMKALIPIFELLAEEANTKIKNLSAQNLTGEAYARDYLPVLISLKAAEKVLIFLENNLSYLVPTCCYDQWLQFPSAPHPKPGGESGTGSTERNDRKQGGF